MQLDLMAPELIGAVGGSALWIGFAGMAVPTIIFYSLFLKAAPGSRLVHVYTMAITSMASLSYLFMATGHGYTLVDGRAFYYMRYVDWALTTPLLLLDLCALVGADAEKTTLLVLMDVLMILAGVIGGLVSTWHKYLFWGLGMVFFAPIVWELAAGLHGAAASRGESHKKVFNVLSITTLVLWSAYPVVWVLAEGTGIVSTDVEAVLYCVLDVAAKSGFGLYLLLSPHSPASDTYAPLAGDSA